MENMKGKNLIQDEKENAPQKESPQKVTLTIEGFLTQMGVEWERKGRAVYIYPSSLETVRKILEKMPSPQEDQYAIIPLGQSNGYSVFIMVTKSGVSMRIGYGRNSIPYTPALSGIVDKLGKISKDLGVESRRNGKNLLE